MKTLAEWRADQPADVRIAYFREIIFHLHSGYTLAANGLITWEEAGMVDAVVSEVRAGKTTAREAAEWLVRKTQRG